MTRSDIVTAVRGLLNDDAFDATLITQAANWFVNQLFTDYRLRLAETSDTLSANLGDTEVEFPDDMLTHLEIYVTSPSVYALQRPMEYDSFMQRYANFASATGAAARTWTRFGNVMRFAAPLKTATTFQIDYLRTPESMVNDTDECEIPDSYEELVNKATLARVMEINEDYAEAQQERANFAPLITTFVRNEGRGGGKTGPTVMRTNRRGRGTGWSISRDF